MKKKAFFISLIVLVALTVCAYVFSGFYLKDDDISGFKGVNSIIGMKLQNKHWIKISNNPNPQILTDSLSSLSESYKIKDTLDWTGTIFYEGQEHQYNARSFSQSFIIVTIL